MNRDIRGRLLGVDSAVHDFRKLPLLGQGKTNALEIWSWRVSCKCLEVQLEQGLHGPQRVEIEAQRVATVDAHRT